MVRVKDELYLQTLESHLQPQRGLLKVKNNYMKKVNYKYDEGLILQEVKKYIDATYDEHYSQNKYQSTEFIIDSGHGEGFCIGNILKYAQRYGRKEDKNRSDLLKLIHYGIIALHVNDLEGEK